MCAHNEGFIALNADQDKYLNYEKSTNGNTIGNTCVRCHDSKRLDSFPRPKQFNIADGWICRSSTYREVNTQSECKPKISS